MKTLPVLAPSRTKSSCKAALHLQTAELLFSQVVTTLTGIEVVFQKALFQPLYLLHGSNASHRSLILGLVLAAE